MEIDIQSAFSTDPLPQDFVIPGFLAGTVGALVAQGAVGKSFFALQIAASVAAPECDTLNLDIKTHGRVVYYNGEDPEDEIKRRIHALGAALSPTARAGVASKLKIVPAMGMMLDIMNEDHRRRIIDHASGARLIIFDTLSRIHTRDENDNGAMAHLVATFENLANNTGASVLFLHHISKSASFSNGGDHQHAARGASSLTENPRFCAYLSKMTEKEAAKLSNSKDRRPIDKDHARRYIRMGVSKQNYGTHLSEKWLIRTQGGILKPCFLNYAKPEKAEKVKGNWK